MANSSLITVVISADREIHEEIAAALNGNPEVERLRTLTEYPDRAALSDIRESADGCVVRATCQSP